jgi:signal transduction histidine kinase
MESCAEMVEMIDTMLGVHKFEAGKMPMDFKAEEPLQLIQRTLSRYNTVAKRAQIHLSATVPTNLPPIAVDRATFPRLLGNLLTNSLKFTAEGGEIEVSAGLLEDFSTIRERIPPTSYPAEQLPERGRFVRITVSDSGVGIAAKELETIFDRFVQAKIRRQGKSGGTGLGLTFCRKVMDAHHGYIWAESVVGQGSSFIMLFPVAE